jgi:uncharacterized membrane protein
MRERAPLTRLRYLDWIRGLAVLLMVHAHTLDAWTQFESRSGAAFRYLTVLGGFSAPLFLWLAGVGLAIAGERRIAAGASRAGAVRSIVLRGLEIFVLAFAFRLQAWLVTPGSPPSALLRVDILNVMGPSIAVAGLLWGVSQTTARAAISCSLVASLIALGTPVIRSAEWMSPWPRWIQAYLNPGTPGGFTLFPWSGFVFAGVMVGLALYRLKPERRKSNELWLGVTGVLLAAVGYACSYGPAVFADSSFWTTSPTYFSIRVGLLMVALSVASRVVVDGGRSEWMTRFGRHSLLVYWIHVELVYGYATWALRRQLNLWQEAIAYCAFVLCLYSVIAMVEKLDRRYRRQAQLEPMP